MVKKQNRAQAFFRHPLSQIILFVVILAVIQLLSMAGIVSNSLVFAIGNTLIYAIIAIGFCLLLGYSGLASLAPDGASILLVSLLAACAPSASNVTQIAQVYGHEGDYASAINVMSTLLCIVTMPLMVLLYQL